MIPYGKHHVDEEDIKSVIKVLKSDNLTQGPLIAAFEKEISKYVGAKYSVAVTSCTAGLHLAAIVSKINKGKVLLNFSNYICCYSKFIFILWWRNNICRY